MKYNSLATNLSRKLTAAKSEHTRDVAATLDGTDWRFCDSILKEKHAKSISNYWLVSNL